MNEIFDKLNKIYSQLPNALGCVGCGKCCKVQHPHCYYSEFLNIYEYIAKEWGPENMKRLHLECVINYLSNSMQKRCVFLNSENSCLIYDCRDFNCRAFGIIPKKVYAKRVRDVVKKFPGINLKLVKQSDCCGDVRPETFIGGNKIDLLFKQIYDLDIECGVSEEDVSESNNYMTFHDHYILYYFKHHADLLRQLTHVKLNFDEKQKEEFVQNMKEQMWKK